MRKTLAQLVTPEQLDALYHRTLTVRQLAKDLGYSESWVGKSLPARAPRRDPKLLRKTRIEFQNQIVAQYLSQGISAKQAAAMSFTSPRTFFRRLKDYKNGQS
jgi:transposase